MAVVEDGHSLAPGPGLSLGHSEGKAWLVAEHASPALAGWYQLTAYSTAGSITAQARVVVEPVAGQEEEEGTRGLVLPSPTRVIEPE